MDHPFTIDLEEYFQIASGGHGVPQRHWDRLPSRLERNVEAALDLLQRTRTTATFCVGDWIARRYPDLVADIANEGHEVACSINRSSVAQYADVVQRLESASSRVIQGCRIANDSVITAGARGGIAAAFDWESSFAPILAWSRPSDPCSFPIPSVQIAGKVWPTECLLLRQRPETGAAQQVAAWAKSRRRRALSFRLWELDPEVPRLAVLSPVHRWLIYRNLDVFLPRIEALLNHARFVPVRAALGLAEEPVNRAAPSPVVPIAAPRPAMTETRPLTVVVPCFNEEEGLAYLGNALDALNASLGRRGSLSFVLVDDGSTDGTWREMERLFGADARFRLVRHERNRGIGAAILTGMAAAETEAVAVIDSDCSYDPARLEEMLPLLAPDVALVTASPYHALGGVEGVPRWRLALSRGASRLYRLVLNNKLATYTSCFRIYRRSALDGLRLRHEGFIGVAETLARLDLDGWRIAEHPVVLESRMFGQSKLKVLKVIAGHLQLLSEVIAERVRFVRRGGIGVTAKEVTD